MKAVVAAFNQEKALVGAFTVITNLRIAFVWTSTGRRRPATIKGGDRGRARSAHRANIVLQVVDAGESPPCWTPWLLPLSPHTSGGKYFSEHLNIFQMNSFMLRDRENKVVCCPGETFSRQNIWCIKSVNVVLWNTLGAHFIFENILTPVNLASGDLAL